MIMDIPQKYIEKICQTMNIASLMGGFQSLVNAKGEVVDSFILEYIWIVYERHLREGPFVLSVSKTRPVKSKDFKLQAIMIIPEIKDIQPDKYYPPVFLDEDKVIEALRSTSLVHDERRIEGEYDPALLNFSLLVATDQNRASFHYFGLTAYASISPLIRAIRDVTNDVRKVYQQPEIDAYFEQQQRLFGDHFED